ncbi:DinB family protein [Mesonia ostreae]|uniref:DinB family protein n=1 Tax=Mesonia ostreae TaxID=861110 RepID=A0ABU2KEP9_9FLAO|nr:DinB family protein [Mesonia ostreae]MDT0293186.1 DinB family protein [Mesonia ostreae]
MTNLYKEMSFETLIYRYAEDKWTPKEMLLHLIDSERIFCTRALRFARKDKTLLSGYDHEDFVKESGANTRSLESLLEEYNMQRQSSILLFKSFTKDMLQRKGNANGLEVSVAALGLIISGHELHHVQILKERYL